MGSKSGISNQNLRYVYKYTCVRYTIPKYDLQLCIYSIYLSSNANRVTIENLNKNLKALGLKVILSPSPPHRLVSHASLPSHLFICVFCKLATVDLFALYSKPKCIWDPIKANKENSNTFVPQKCLAEWKNRKMKSSVPSSFGLLVLAKPKKQKWFFCGSFLKPLKNAGSLSFELFLSCPKS